MNKILFLILSLILVACSPQATVTSPPPTETPIPTPTLHPDFVALQDLIADSSDRFTLLPDGTIEEVTVNGGQQTVPNLHVDQNGIINIIFNNEHVAIEQSQITFDDENGLIIEGYEQNEDGEWVEAAVTRSLDEIKAMDLAEIMAIAPEIDGYSPIRTAERYIIYEGADGMRDVAYDLTTGEQVEIPQYKICSAEKFYDCVIPQEDLMNGKYWLWLNTLDVQFDPEKIKDVPIVIREAFYVPEWKRGLEMFHDSGADKPPDFTDPATAPFDRDVTHGVVLYQENGASSYGEVRPIAFYDRDTGQVHWVVALSSVYDYHEGVNFNPRLPEEHINLNNWINNYNVTPLLTGFYSVHTGLPDPVLSHTYEVYPDVEARFAAFAAGDMAALSAP